MPETAFDTFLAAAWHDHGDHPREVADRIAASLHVVNSPEQVPRIAGLLTHVYGEHLGQWHRGVELLESLRSCAASHQGAIGSLDRGIATLRYAGGDRDALQPLPRESRVSVLAAAAAMFAGRRDFAGALSAFAEALRLAEPDFPPGSPAIRSLAVGGNNLAAALESKSTRDGVETQGMVTAAEAGLKYWKRAGTWLEEERAEYRLTRSLLQAGQTDAAIRSAQRCIEICESNAAPAFEQFFGHAVLALAQRAAGNAASFAASRQRALQLFAQVPDGEMQWCEAELKELES
jgi:hypothetical protein